MSLYAFHLGQIISNVLGQVDHDGQHGNAARTPIRGETSETDHTQKRRLLTTPKNDVVTSCKLTYLAKFSTLLDPLFMGDFVDILPKMYIISHIMV
jgi:hypothetical protein